jgi:hypothetical protein
VNNDTGARPVRIANCSGFFGDRLSAAREMVEGGPIDVLTGDYLAELTMLILFKTKIKHPDAGYARTFLTQMEQVLGTCLDRGIKVVTNAGGLNPAGCAGALRELAAKLGLNVRVAHIEGDDLLPQLADLQAAGHGLEHLDRGVSLAAAGVKPVTANAYLGAWGIVEALRADADVVVCPRVTDASLVVGPAAWWFDWARDDWDALAGAVVAGHVLECGAQATGGNYSFFNEIDRTRPLGFPLAEIDADGSSVITKHDGTGGAVSVGTVTAQLLYEIAEPAYMGPDVVSRFDTITLADDGTDRVRISGVRGAPAPSSLKVCINYIGGFRNTMTFILTGLDIEEKAAWIRRALLEDPGAEFETVDVRLVRADRADAATVEGASAFLRVTVKDPDPGKVGRTFSNASIELALASYPGYTVTSPPADATPYGVYWPALVPASEVSHRVVLPDDTVLEVPHSPTNGDVQITPAPGPTVAASGDTQWAPLGAAFGARSGDKGGNANVGVWARSAEGYSWLAQFLTIERFKELLPEAADLPVRRFELPNILALNFVVVGFLGDGVSSSTRFDPQAKALGEFLRSRIVDLPLALIQA